MGSKLLKGWHDVPSWMIKEECSIIWRVFHDTEKSFLHINIEIKIKKKLIWIMTLSGCKKSFIKNKNSLESFQFKLC